MYRFMTLVLVAATIASAFVLYVVNYRTRALEHELRAAEEKHEELAREVQTLSADRAFLARPERISEAARELGMRPASGDQFVVRRPTGGSSFDQSAKSLTEEEGTADAVR